MTEEVRTSNNEPMERIWASVNETIEREYPDGAIAWATRNRPGLMMACDRLEAAISGAMREGQRGRFLALCVRYHAAWKALGEAFRAREVAAGA